MSVSHRTLEDQQKFSAHQWALKTGQGVYASSRDEAQTHFDRQMKPFMKPTLKEPTLDFMQRAIFAGGVIFFFSLAGLGVWPFVKLVESVFVQIFALK